jgi:hypothetical protein
MTSGRALRLIVIAAIAVLASVVVAPVGRVASATAAGEIAQTFFLPILEDELRASAAGLILVLLGGAFALVARGWSRERGEGAT